MTVIEIPEFEFDSLIDWKDPYDIKEVYPYLTSQECRLASNFTLFKELDSKALILLLIVKSMINRNAFEDEQLLFITELINANVLIRSSLIQSFNKKAESNGFDIRLQMEDEYV